MQEGCGLFHKVILGSSQVGDLPSLTSDFQDSPGRGAELKINVNANTKTTTSVKRQEKGERESWKRKQRAKRKQRCPSGMKYLRPRLRGQWGWNTNLQVTWIQKADHRGLREGHSSTGFSELPKFFVVGGGGFFVIHWHPQGISAPSAERSHEGFSESSADEAPLGAWSPALRSDSDEEGKDGCRWAPGSRSLRSKLLFLWAQHTARSPVLPWFHVATLKMAKKGNIAQA